MRHLPTCAHSLHLFMLHHTSEIIASSLFISIFTYLSFVVFQVVTVTCRKARATGKMRIVDGIPLY